nr:hypothetical protein [Tanacetum cinerariifolium]
MDFTYGRIGFILNPNSNDNMKSGIHEVFMIAVKNDSYSKFKCNSWLFMEADSFIRELMIESQEAAGDLFRKDIGEVCTAKAVRLISLGTKWFMLLALSDIGHSGELRLLVAFDIVITKTIGYHLFDVVVEFHRVIFLIMLHGGYFESLKGWIGSVFWATAKSKTVNDVKQIHAKVDGKKVVISESSVRSDLHFNDDDGLLVYQMMKFLKTLH